MILTIDVEQWYQVENMRQAVPRARWADMPSRVEASMDTLLGAMADADARSTCFVLGCVARQHPGMVRRIAEAGHEIACHGDGHDLLPSLGPKAFARDLAIAKATLEDIAGQTVTAYRAPCFSLTDWALPILAEQGFRVDSSFYPTRVHDRAGRIAGTDCDQAAMRVGADLVELPASVLRVAGRHLPWAGGGYFRLLPRSVFEAGMRRIVARQGVYVFFLHPWEVDPDQPRVQGMSKLSRFRHYHRLGSTLDRFKCLLQRYRWTSVQHWHSQLDPATLKSNHIGTELARHKRAA